MILHINVPFSKTEELKPENKNNEDEENIFVFPSMQMEGIAAASSRHSIFIKTVTSNIMLSALLNWFKLVQLSKGICTLRSISAQASLEGIK